MELAKHVIIDVHVLWEWASSCSFRGGYMLSSASITIKLLLTNESFLLTINYLILTLYVFWAPILQKISMHVQIHNCLFS